MLRRQQGGEGVMFREGIMGSELAGCLRIPNGVKMNSVTCVEFLINVIPWYRKKCVK